MNKPTLSQVEAALDEGRLEARMGNGRWWRIRRNGMTKRWKTRPSEFRIPVKAGLRSCGELTHDNRFGDDCDFRLVTDYVWVGDTAHSILRAKLLCGA